MNKEPSINVCGRRPEVWEYFCFYFFLIALQARKDIRAVSFLFYLSSSFKNNYIVGEQKAGI